ncbi:MAG: hypothetical protein FWF51_09270, partial [Chitinivibrionia bacterium]|nr:hypothetical protein [Chitinivibrionia bacterium]
PGTKFAKETLSQRLEFIEYEFNDVHPKGDDLKVNKDAWQGNYIIWDDIIKKFSTKKISFFTYFFKTSKNEGD